MLSYPSAMSKYGSLLFPSPSEFHAIGPFRFPIHKELLPGELIGIEKIEEFAEVQSAGVSPTQTHLAYVTLLMQYRGQAKLPKARDWSPTRDWTAEDSEQIPAEMRRSIYQFILWERDGWPEPEGKPEEAETLDPVES